MLSLDHGLYLMNTVTKSHNLLYQSKNSGHNDRST